MISKDKVHCCKLHNGFTKIATINGSQSEKRAFTICTQYDMAKYKELLREGLVIWLWPIYHNNIMYNERCITFRELSGNKTQHHS